MERIVALVIPQERNGKTVNWLRIGRGTRLAEGKIICTLESIPLNWDGTFYVFDKKPIPGTQALAADRTDEDVGAAAAAEETP